MIWLTLDNDGFAPLDDGFVTIIGSREGSFVRLPPQLGNTPHQVLTDVVLPCPLCSANCVHLTLADTEVKVAICHNHTEAYLWYKER